MHRVLLSSLIGLLGLPAVAWADTFVVAPLLSPDLEASHNVTSLISAELDFQPVVDDLVDIDTPPSSSGCLTSSSCLSRLASAGGGDKLITGSLATSSTTYTIDLVYFDAAAGRTVRRNSFELEASPEAIADGMTAVIREILTGKAPAEEEAEEPTADDFDFSSDGDDGFAFEDDLETDDAPRQAEEEAARRRAEEEARRRAEAERRREEEARRRAEAERRQRAEAERRRAEEEARRRAEAERRQRAEAERREAEARRTASADDDFDPDSISFSSASSEMQVESADEISFAPASGQVDDDEDLDDDFAIADLDDEPIEDLDGPTERSRRDRSRSTRTSRRSPTRAQPPAADGPSVSITARGGYSRYFQLDFITYGGELAVPLGRSGLQVLGGVEAYSVNRTLPDDLAQQLGRETAWDTIFPFNAGLKYSFGQGAVVPYLGADAIFGQYFVDPESSASSWALGGRVRGGADFMISDLFGINVNVALGGWHGSKWTLIDTGMENTGVLPQLSAGTVFSF